jgi:HEAT repeat protein
MITWFCPECFAEVDETAERCPACGCSTDMTGWTYEQKVLKALDHRHLPDRRVLAAQILGRLRSRAAVPRLAELAGDPTDLYLAAEAARSLALIDPDHPVVLRLREAGPLLVRTSLRQVAR